MCEKVKPTTWIEAKATFRCGFTKK